MQESNKCLKNPLLGNMHVQNLNCRKIARFELFLTGIGQLCKSDQIGRHSKKRFFQNLILRNTHRHQPFDFYENAELRKTLVAELRKT